MMDWLSDDPGRGQAVLGFLALAITAIIVWLGLVLLGRKGLVFTILAACAWLLLAAVAIPGFIPARNVAHRNACINNLKQIREAKIAWANAEHKSITDIPTEEVLYGSGTHGFLRHKPVCPRGGKYAIGAVGEPQRAVLQTKGTNLNNSLSV